MPPNSSTVLVTGASRGIGLAIVSSLLGKENEQFRVIGTSRLNPIPAYAASKGGLVAFTKSISRSLGKKRIVAYSIASGFVETDMATESISVYGEDYLKEGLSFDTLTQPEEIAEMVVFLASGKVKHMTGSTFHINGGSYLI